MIRQSSPLTKLPLEIISNILTRIPILLIVRLKCFCHAWLELFDSPEFSKLHLSKSSAGLLVDQHLGGSYMIKIFRFEDELVVECQQLNYTPVRRFDLTEFKCHTISGSVDGFLCFRHVGHIDNLYICNPITCEYISLPTLESCVQFPSMVTYGFGVSTISCQHKVVRIFHESELDQAGVTAMSDFYMFDYSNKNKTTSKMDVVEMACCGSVESILHVPALVSLTCFGRENVNSL
ncbi:putative F-box protein At1g47790 [Primulina eburnea]|uniref:putative F-box protein At1g47790 n=1 Tax=Primulina eburnea TaxID=1245227 RepID=UPI003C6CAE0E